jgi:hypothetical protein
VHAGAVHEVQFGEVQADRPPASAQFLQTLSENRRGRQVKLARQRGSQSCAVLGLMNLERSGHLGLVAAPSSISPREVTGRFFPEFGIEQ